MKKNLYFRQTLRRQNTIKEAIFDFALGLCSWPRLILEVFIRKNFGERYFSIATAGWVFAFLLIVPSFSSLFNTLYESIFGSSLGIGSYSSRYGGASPSWGAYQNQYAASEEEVQTGSDWLPFLGRYATWYIFAGLFLYASILRYKEVLHNPSVFDFARFSLSSGQTDPRLIIFKDAEGKPNYRILETLVEPAPFLAGGIFLWLINQPLGLLLIICSLLYSLSYFATYRIGDNFIMDKIDELIFNEQLADVYVKKKSPAHAKGVLPRCPIPESVELRKEIAAMFFEEEEAVRVE